MVRANKKGVAERAKQLITELVREPILPYEEGEATRFSLNQGMADITALIWTYNKQIKSLELDLSISTPLNI